MGPEDGGTITTSYGGAAAAPTQPKIELAEPRASVQPGTRLGRYVVEATLGHGGMGIVVSARDPDLARQVALKLVRPDAGRRAYRGRLVREARAMAKLEHPNVVRVYDAGEVGGDVFIAMELVRGETLGVWMRAAPRPWREVVARFIAAGRGLAAAHHAGLVHRDFKPDNVLVRASDGRVCVTDFGLAVPAIGDGEPDAPLDDALSGEATMTRTGAVAGTPAYMAPEQRRGGDVDARADIFSFCVSLYEALHGVRPVDADGGASPSSELPPDGARRRGGRVPGSVRRAIRRGLAADPAARWPAIDPLLAVLERASRRRRVVLAVLAAAALAGAGFALAASRPPHGLPFNYEKASRVTFAAGCEEQPAFLRDGRVVYARRAGPGAILEIVRSDNTSDTLGPGAAPAVSPSGRYLAALDRSTLTVRDLQRPSDPPRPLGATTCQPAWLDDHEVIAGVGNRVIARELGGGERELGHVPAGNLVRNAVAGANGRIFVVYRADAAVAEDYLAELLPSGGTRELRRGVYGPAGIHYRAANNVLYFVNRMNSQQYHLFGLDVDATGDPTPMVSDAPPAGGFDVMPDGKSLVFSTCLDAATIVRIPRDGRLAELTQRGDWRDGAPIVIDAGRFVYTSTRGGALQVWLHDTAAHTDRPLTQPESSYPSIAPDRATMVYTAYDGPNGKLIVRPVASATPERTLTSGFLDRAPRFTRDGQTVMFLRQTPAGIQLYRVPATGGAPAEVMPRPVRVFDVSPAADLVVFVEPGDRDRLRMLALPSGEVRDVAGAGALGAKLRFVRFAPDGGAVMVIDGDSTISELDLGSGAVRPRWRLDGTDYTAAPAVEVDADGALIAALIRVDGDLWIAQGSF